MNILALLAVLSPYLSETDIRRMRWVAQAMLSMTGRVTMLGISRWTGKGGSYRSIQRLFKTKIPWIKVFLLFFKKHLFNVKFEYLLVGDESVITKSGKHTFGIDRFYAGLLKKVVKSIAIFSLSIASVEERHSYPLQVEQVLRTEEEKESAKKKKNKKSKKKSNPKKKKLGRPKGSKNRDKTQVSLTPELLRIQNMIKKQLQLLQPLVKIRHIALDGHFGNNNALQMVLLSGLDLVSKLRSDSALYFLYEGQQKARGPKRKYGNKVDYRNIPVKYLVSQKTEKGIQTKIYQSKMLHKSFAQMLNVVIITKTNLKTGAFAHVVLFSSDMKLSFEKIIDYYSLRFQIEFNFRDAKQFWGLEDFMNIKEVQLTNALNLSLFMTNLSQVLLREFRHTNPESGILDLKAYYRAAKYFEETIKMLPQKPEPILFEQIFGRLASFSSVHTANSPLLPP
ncbi:MAG: transposase [Anaerolineales bacterium]|nr:transposase [Anaerolineales bacterium]